jgi:hypothetical protein
MRRYMWPARAWAMTIEALVLVSSHRLKLLTTDGLSEIAIGDTVDISIEGLHPQTADNADSRL